MMPFSCAASSASAICRAIGSVFIHWNRTAHQSLRQVLAFHQLHNDGTTPAALLETVDVCDIRMVQRCERLRLTREPRRAIAIRSEQLGHDLQSNFPTELGVVCAVHLPHAARTKGGNDLIRAEARSRSQGQV